MKKCVSLTYISLGEKSEQLEKTWSQKNYEISITLKYLI